MDLSNPQVVLILIAGFLLIYLLIVAALMMYASPVLHYRKVKGEDEDTMLRFIIIPFTLPFRVMLTVLIYLAKGAKWLLFIVVGVTALALSPLYLFVYRPVKAYFTDFNEQVANFDKFVVFFRPAIRLGNWLMFYKSEPVNTQRQRSKTTRTFPVRGPRP